MSLTPAKAGFKPVFPVGPSCVPGRFKAFPVGSNVCARSVQGSFAGSVQAVLLRVVAAPVRRPRRSEARPLVELSDFQPAVLSDFGPALT
jgi:hypothetical protein